MPKKKDTKKKTAGKKKTTPKKKTAAEKKKTPKLKKERYFEGLGKRKTSVARVRLFPLKSDQKKKEKKESSSKEKSFLVNKKPLEEYFSTKELQKRALSSLGLMNCLGEFKVSVKLKGGGIVSQAEAVRHGIARALILFNSSFRKKLKKAGYLTRDPRMRERKKFGLKRARRAPQWSKR